MDLGFLQDYYIPVVLIACLIVGYCIKHITWLEKVSNQYIPTILAVLGAVLACVSAGLAKYSNRVRNRCVWSVYRISKYRIAPGIYKDYQ